MKLKHYVTVVIARVTFHILSQTLNATSFTGFHVSCVCFFFFFFFDSFFSNFFSWVGGDDFQGGGGGGGVHGTPVHVQIFFFVLSC